VGIRVFSAEYIDTLVAEAEESSRRRQHRNIHSDYSDPVQRLFNAIEPESYIRPHRHGSANRSELMIAVRGLMVLLVFDDYGRVLRKEPFGIGAIREELAAGVEVPPECWHTVVALRDGAVLLEVKGGPFNPDSAKEFASWAPDEGSAGANAYHQQLVSIAAPWFKTRKPFS
jgi:cupin fold WbuC family metalloprotein